MSLRALDFSLGRQGWLVIVPTARSPHKPDGPIGSDADRLAMVRLAWAGYPRATVWTDELDRGSEGPSYWVQTLRRAREVTVGRLAFLIGADQAANLHRWKDARDVVRLAEPIVVPRRPIIGRDSLRLALESASFWAGDEVSRLVAGLIEVDPLDASSTGIREGEHDQMPAAVKDYAARHTLYEAGPIQTKSPASGGAGSGLSGSA